MVPVDDVITDSTCPKPSLEPNPASDVQGSITPGRGSGAYCGSWGIIYDSCHQNTYGFSYKDSIEFSCNLFSVSLRLLGKEGVSELLQI